MAELDQCITVLAVAGAHFPKRVSARKRDRNQHCGCGPNVNLTLDALRLGGSLELCRQNQAKRRNNWKDSVDPFRWKQRHCNQPGKSPTNQPPRLWSDRSKA